MSKEIYVKEKPKSCYICPCYDTSEGFCSITGSYIKYKKGRILQDCQLIDIKTHDRELVKEVCEKIARNVRVRKIQEEWYVIETDLRAILDKIQKEFEDE